MGPYQDNAPLFEGHFYAFRVSLGKVHPALLDELSRISSLGGSSFSVLPGSLWVLQCSCITIMLRVRSQNFSAQT